MKNFQERDQRPVELKHPKSKLLTAKQTKSVTGDYLDRLDVFETYSELVGVLEDSKISQSANKTEFIVKLNLDRGEKPQDYLERVKKACDDANKVGQEKLQVEGRFRLDESGREIIFSAQDNDSLTKAVKDLGKSVEPALRIGAAVR